jgi:RNA recognition motif-containing protein
VSRGAYSAGKRQRENDKARKKQDKALRRRQKRDRGPGEVPITTAEEITGALPSVDEAMRAIETRASAPREAEPLPARLFVGGLSRNTTEERLREAFSEHGEVTDAFIVTDRDTGSSRGFGFVTLKNRKDASKAIEALSDSELDGRTIVVNVATERQR